MKRTWQLANELLGKYFVNIVANVLRNSSCKILTIDGPYSNLFFFFIGEPRIVAPFPKRIFPFEYEKAEVTCVVTDTTGAKPDDIEFVRKSQFGDPTKIPDEGKSGRIYYENRTEGNYHKSLVMPQKSQEPHLAKKLLKRPVYHVKIAFKYLISG